MKIVKFPDIALVTKSTNITDFNEYLVILGKNMLDLMHESQGVGLAANQVALNKRIFVMHCYKNDPSYIFINPVIVYQSAEYNKNIEGCLSFPGLNIELTRPVWIVLEWRDTKGKEFSKKFYDLEAICIQHEIDHLDGINFVDRLGRVKKMMILKRYTALNKIK